MVSEAFDALPLHVLVVDDEPGIRDLIRLALEPRGWKVFEAASTAEAEALIQKCRPSFLLVDVHLPDGRGDVWLEKHRGQWRHTAVILLTGDDADSVAAALDGVSVLSKPFRLRDLISAIETHR